MFASTTVQADIRVDNTGFTLELPVIITEEGVLRSYLEYLLAFRYKSESWKRRSVFSIRLLLDYINTNKGVFEKPRDMFRGFSNALFTGTICGAGNDPSGLRWTPRKYEDANFIINLITHYTDYLAEVNEDEDLQLNCFRKASPFEQKLNWAAYYQKKDRVFLSHLWKRPDAVVLTRRVRSVGLPSKIVSHGAYDIAKAFPEGRISDLIYHGFVLPSQNNCEMLSKRLNLRDVLMTMLMHYGGLRISEVCHIYTHDIAEFSGGSLNQVIKIYHPSEGIAPTDERVTRREYLLRRFGLKSRNEYPGSSKQFAGWKDSLLTNSKDKFFKVEFFPESAREQFFVLWKLYIKYQRVRPEIGAEHPYAFTSRKGTPYTIKGYAQSNKRAVERIGLTFSKESCTTSHAHRHRYGQNLAESGVSAIVIKTAMHHRSLESQNTYTQPTEKQIRLQFKKAEQNIPTSSSTKLTFVAGRQNE